MKKILLFLSLCMMTALSSCETQNNESSSSVNYDYIGEIHNQGLDRILNSLIRTRSQLDFSDLTAEERVGIIKDSTLAFVAGQKVPKEVIDFTEVQLNKRLTIDDVANGSFELKTDIYPANFQKAEFPILTNKLSVLNTIVTDDDLDVNSLLSRIDVLESTGNTNLSEEDLHILYCATSTAKYSLLYWSENIDEWAAACGVSNDNEKKFKWKNVLIADINGAIDGAIECGIARFFGPLGWKVWVVGIGASALADSAKDAVGQLIDIHQ